MTTFNKMFVIALVASLATSLGAEEITHVEQNFIESSNSSQNAILTQLVAKESGSVDATYSYRCTVGSYVSSRLACTASDSTSWSTAHDVQLKLRCPKSGSGLTLSYVQVDFSVTSQSVNCFVNEGAVGLGYIGLTINAWSTQLFKYSGYFYSY